MTFSTTNLMNDRVLVQGTDIAGTRGQTILDATQWNELKLRTDFNDAQQAFDSEVEAFFAPITEAAEKMAAALERPTDSVSYIVLDEEVEGTPSKPGTVVHLTKDSIVLRLVEQGDTDRLVWVGDSLEITAAPVAQAPAAPANLDLPGEGGPDA